MGYSTRFSLAVQLMIGGKIAELKDNSPLESVIAQLRQENESAAYAIDEDGSGTGEGSKWYEHEKEMREFSAKHPNVLFTLSGEGEENADVWNKYFLGGKCQTAEAEFQIAPFDVKKLK